MNDNEDIKQHIKSFSEKKSKKKKMKITNLNKELISNKQYNIKNKKTLKLNFNDSNPNRNNNMNKINFTTMVKQLPNKLYLNKNSNKTFKSKEIILCNYSKSLEDINKNINLNKRNEIKFRNTTNTNLNLLKQKTFNGDLIFPKNKNLSSFEITKNNNNFNKELNFFHPDKIIINQLFKRKLPSNNLYLLLSQKQMKYLSKFPYQENKDNIDDEMKVKKKFFNSPSNSMTYILSKYKDSDLPTVYPSSISFSKNYKTQSEKDRNDKNSNLLIKIKYFLENHWEKKYEIINDFFNQNNIFDEKYYNKKYFDNFSNYIRYNIENINCKKSLKEIIDEGIKFEYDLEKEKKVKKDKKTNQNFNDENVKSELENYKKYLNKIYRDNNNKNKLYFHHKYGKIDTFQEKNLANYLPKQQLLYKKNNNISSSPFNKGSVKLFDENDIKELEKEINSLQDIKQLDNDRNNERNIRLYYKPNFKKLEIKPDEIPRRKKKLLEYIILQNVKNKHAFIQEINKEYE